MQREIRLVLEDSKDLPSEFWNEVERSFEAFSNPSIENLSIKMVSCEVKDLINNVNN